jgi:hypothetical protein
MGKSSGEAMFRIVGATGGLCLATSIGWLYVWSRRFRDLAPGIDITAPQGARALFVFGCVTFVIAASALSGSKLLKSISIVGSAGLAGGLAWLKLWDDFVVERGSAYSWQAPVTATWIVQGSCMVLGVAGFAALVLICISWLRTRSKRVSVGGAPNKLR